MHGGWMIFYFLTRSWVPWGPVYWVSSPSAQPRALNAVCNNCCLFNCFEEKWRWIWSGEGTLRYKSCRLVTLGVFGKPSWQRSESTCSSVMEYNGGEWLIAPPEFLPVCHIQIPFLGCVRDCLSLILGLLCHFFPSFSLSSSFKAWISINCLYNSASFDLKQFVGRASVFS